MAGGDSASGAGAVASAAGSAAGVAGSADGATRALTGLPWRLVEEPETTGSSATDAVSTGGEASSCGSWRPRLSAPFFLTLPGSVSTGGVEVSTSDAVTTAAGSTLGP